MKKLILILSLFIASAVNADWNRVDTIVTTCVEKMKDGSCTVLGDSGDYTKERLATPMHLGALGRVPFSAYLAIRGSGDIQMCSAALDACKSDFNGDRCKVARKIWGGE